MFSQLKELCGVAGSRTTPYHPMGCPDQKPDSQRRTRIHSYWEEAVHTVVKQMGPDLLVYELDLRGGEVVLGSCTETFSCLM